MMKGIDETIDTHGGNPISGKPYEWQQPKVYSLWTSKVLLGGWKGKFFRTLIIVAAIELFFYFLLKPLPLKEIEFNIDKALLLLFLFALGMSTFIYLVAPYLIRFNRSKYKIDDKGIKVDSFSSSRIYLWKNIVKCQPVEKHEQLEGIICIYFHTKQSSRPHVLVFDTAQNDLAKKIHNTIKEKLSGQIEIPTRKLPRIKLNTYQHIYMISLSMIGAFLFIYFIIPRLIMGLNNDIGPLIFFLSVLLLGPGTWGMVILFGKSLFKYRDWFAWMNVYNFITLILIVVIKVILVILELSKTFQQNS